MLRTASNVAEVVTKNGERRIWTEATTAQMYGQMSGRPADGRAILKGKLVQKGDADASFYNSRLYVMAPRFLALYYVFRTRCDCFTSNNDHQRAPKERLWV